MVVRPPPGLAPMSDAAGTFPLGEPAFQPTSLALSCSGPGTGGNTCRDICCLVGFQLNSVQKSKQQLKNSQSQMFHQKHASDLHTLLRFLWEKKNNLFCLSGSCSWRLCRNFLGVSAETWGRGVNVASLLCKNSKHKDDVACCVQILVLKGTETT